MDLPVYSEAELQAKKYGELLKIGKSLGARCTASAGGRIKTSKLIEVILETQSTKCISEDAATVIDALDEDCSSNISKVNDNDQPTQEAEPKELEEPVPSEELLSDIQFPQEMDGEEASDIQGQLEKEEQAGGRTETNNGGGTSKKERKNKRRSTGTFEVDTDVEGSSAGKEKIGSSNKRRRTGTFEVDTDVEGSSAGKEKIGSSNKRRRTGTFEINDDASEHDVTKIVKRRRTSTFEINTEKDATDSSQDINNDKVEENTQQLEALTKLVAEEKQQCQSAGSPLPSSKPDAEKRNSRSRSFVIDKTDEKETAPQVDKTVVSQESTSTPTHKTPKRQKTTERKSVIGSASQRSARKSVTVSTKYPVMRTPGSQRRDPPASKIMKPLFNVGRGDSTTKEEKEGPRQLGTGIPRFVSFARKLKVPDFAKIHARAFKRMDGLADYVDKKHKRTDSTNSSTKKPKPRPASGDIFKPDVTSVKNLNLNFMAASSPAKAGKTPVSKPEKSGTTKSPQVAPKTPKETASESGLKSGKKSPKAKPAVKPSYSRLKSPKVLTRKSPKIPVLTRKSPRFGNPIKPTSVAGATHKSPSVSKVSPPRFGNPIKPTSVAGATRKSPSVSKVSPKARYGTLPRPLKENVKPGRTSVASPAPGKLDTTINPPTNPGCVHKKQEYDPKATMNKPLSYVPYKGTLKAFNSAAVRKQMSEKLPNIKSSKERREDQKKILKGVRFNKRFELQMAKRGIDITH